VPAGCKCYAGYEGSVTAKTGSPFYTYSCKSVLVGGTFALHATVHNRFLRMNGENMERTSAKAKLPSNWDTTFFRIVDAGAGKIGLYNAKNNKYIRMNHEDSRDVKQRPSTWNFFHALFGSFPLSLLQAH
ncbi:unnamed protein product, partial [Symbiodinium microadriaticum]